MTQIYVAGHSGLVGSAICRRLQKAGVTPLTASSRELDLTDQGQVVEWFSSQKIDQVYFAAARVGGIAANAAEPARFIRDNLAMQTNVIHSAWEAGVAKFVFLGSSCIYPKYAEQPIEEDSLLSGQLEPSNESYAIAKIAGLKMCQAYRSQYNFDAISLMPTNLYGPGDNFDLDTSHVLPALLRKFHEARINDRASVEVWGTGTPRREFLYVDDMADAAVYMMKHYSDAPPLNIGWGEDLSIADLARLIAEVVGFAGKIEFDASRPDGTPRKLLDVSRATTLGWRPSVPLRAGLESTYRWYVDNRA